MMCKQTRYLSKEPENGDECRADDRSQLLERRQHRCAEDRRQVLEQLNQDRDARDNRTQLWRILTHDPERLRNRDLASLFLGDVPDLPEHLVQAGQESSARPVERGRRKSTKDLAEVVMKS